MILPPHPDPLPVPTRVVDADPLDSSSIPVTQRLNSRSLGEQRRGPMAGQMAARKEARKQYQFEATASDDELEDELDENLDETLDVTRRLKALAVAAGCVPPLLSLSFRARDERADVFVCV